jgi:hypothetical protein
VQLRTTLVGALVALCLVAAIGATPFGADAGATLVALGSWAAVSGAIQFGAAVRRWRESRQLPMIVSGWYLVAKLSGSVRAER